MIKILVIVSSSTSSGLSPLQAGHQINRSIRFDDRMIKARMVFEAIFATAFTRMEEDEREAWRQAWEMRAHPIKVICFYPEDATRGTFVDIRHLGNPFAPP